MADSIGAREFARICGVTPATVTKWCRNGLIEGAEQDDVGCPWRIPKDAVPPVRKRKLAKNKKS